MLVFLERVSEAQRIASRELRELQDQDSRKKKRKGGRGREGEEGGKDVDEETQDREFADSGGKHKKRKH